MFTKHNLEIKRIWYENTEVYIGL